jgi:Copper chaperone
MNKKISIEGMSCMHCSNRVKNALSALPGVKEVSVDLDGKCALVEADTALSDADLKGAVEDAGYEVVSIQ